MTVEVTWQTLRDVLLEYVENVEDDDSIDRPTPAFISALSNIKISALTNQAECTYDTHIVSFMLARALKLTILQISCMEEVNLDEAFTRQRIGARLKELDISDTKITDATIDVLCEQMSKSLRYLDLMCCDCITQQGKLTNTTTTTCCNNKPNFEQQKYFLYD